jgi:uncharacterized protein (TIGR03435 family)
MRTGLIAMLCCAAAATAGSQSPAPSPAAAAPPLAFEEASIRPSKSIEKFAFIRQDTGSRFVAENIPVSNLIQQAYGVFRFQILDGPGWIDRDRFDVQAIAPGTTRTSSGALLQQLLADRFAFKGRRETREMDVYALVIARADGRLGPNLKPFTGECAPPPGGRSACTMRNGPNFTEAVGFPMSIIVGQAAGNVNRIVIDKTGLTGRFDFKYEWTTDFSATASADGRVPYMTALQEQLGLKLESQRAPVEVLVIENVTPPTPN